MEIRSHIREILGSTVRPKNGSITTSNEIFSPSNKIHREVVWAKDLSAPRYTATSLPTGFSYVVPLPSLTPEYSRVIVCGASQRDSSKFFPLEHSKLSFLLHDVRKRQDFCLSLVWIVDMTNYDVGYMTKISIPLLKKVVSSHKVGNIIGLSLC